MEFQHDIGSLPQLKKRHHAAMSQKWENLFLENTFARLGDCRIIQSCILLLVDFFPKFILENARPCMLYQ
jgi:hypothetical protein